MGNDQPATSETGDAQEGTEHRTLKIAVAGCSHGEMDKIYSQLAQWEQEESLQSFDPSSVSDFKTDLLISCGDYESIRNYADLESMACPPNYRGLHNFHR